MTALNSLIINEVLRVQDPDAKGLGLDRLDEDELIMAFAWWAEGELKEWLDYAKGALLFVMVPEDPESGMFYIYDRAGQRFFMVDLSEVDRYGGYQSSERLKEKREWLAVKAVDEQNERRRLNVGGRF